MEISFSKQAEQILISLMEIYSGFHITELVDPLVGNAFIRQIEIMRRHAVEDATHRVFHNNELLTCAQNVYNETRNQPEEFRQRVREYMEQFLKLMGFRWDCIVALFIVMKKWARNERYQNCPNRDIIKHIIVEFYSIIAINSNWIETAILGWDTFEDEYAWILDDEPHVPFNYNGDNH